MNAATFIALLTITFTLLGVLWQVRAKRVDDKRATQLRRLDEQLSDLYGPLYALYEKGDRQWRAFLKEFSNCKDPNFLGFFPIANEFPPPNAEQLRVFRLWMQSVFMATNIQMEELIINNADLVIGETMPAPFLSFCVHVASLKASVAEWSAPEFDRADWKKHMAIFPHPAADLHIYIKATFEILKKEQSRLLSGEKRFVNEKELHRQITERMAQLHKLAFTKLPGKVESDQKALTTNSH